MELTDRFYIDKNRIQLNKYALTVRHYTDVEMADYRDNTYYLNDDGYKEWTEQLIPKHKLNELVSDEVIDNTDYVWMAGIELRTSDVWREIEEIAACGSLEAYEATLPESRDAFEVETDYRLSMLELGI